MQGRRIGNWDLTTRLGKGGMGEVYLARHRILGTPAAVKVLKAVLAGDTTFRDRFLQEARTMASLHHPNIAQVLDYAEENDLFFLIIEFLDGGSLADVLDQRRGPVELPRSLRWAKQALSALGFAHDKGIVHRDIKCSNIMLDEAGHAKVMDFGVAIEVGSKRTTTSAIAIGTPHYMSPEQISHPRDVDQRTDIYSLGVVLYELLTGRLPFDAETDFAVRHAQVSLPPPPPSSFNPAIPSDLEALLLTALEKDPERRYPTATMFLTALEDFEVRHGLVRYTPPPVAAFETAQPLSERPARSDSSVHKFCAECGTLMKLDARFCPSCGRESHVSGTHSTRRDTRKLCPDCGHEVNAWADFCNTCGRKCA